MSSQVKIFIAFLVMLLLAAVVILWMLVLNTGEIAIHAPAPFIVRADKLYQQCSTEPCVIKMNAYKYTFYIDKAGYFPHQEAITLKRWQTVHVYPKLKFIPYIDEAELSPEDLPSDKSERLRTLVKKGNGFVLKSGEDEIEAPFKDNVLVYGWDSKNNLMYLEREDDSQKLFTWDITGEPVLITQFQSLTKPSLEGGQKHILVLDGEKTYKVDTSKKRKELLYERKIIGIRWNPSGTAALLETEFEGLPLLIIFYDDDGSTAGLPVQSSLARTVWKNDDEVFFITFQEPNDDMKASFAQIGLDAEQLAGSKKEVLQDRLMQYNYRNNSFEELLLMPLHIRLQKIVLSEDGAKLFGITEENAVKQIRLEEYQENGNS